MTAAALNLIAVLVQEIVKIVLAASSTTPAPTAEELTQRVQDRLAARAADVDWLKKAGAKADEEFAKP